MTSILDASAAASIIFRRGAYEQIINTHSIADSVIAPDLYFLEILSVVWKNLQWTDDKSVGADELCRRGYSLIDNSVPVLNYWQLIIDVSNEVKLSPYDISYAVLAEKTGGKLISLDCKLIKIAESLGVSVLSL